jgi:hypothetical protein
VTQRQGNQPVKSEKDDEKWGFGDWEGDETDSDQSSPEREHRVGRNQVFELPLVDFVREVLDRNVWPDSEEWRSPLFDFTRWMKGRNDMPRDGYSAALIVEQALAELAPDDHADPWIYHFGNVTDDARAEFIDTWDKVRTPAGMDTLLAAAREAERLPLRFLRPYTPRYCEVMSLAGHLQQSRAGQKIFLPVERLATLLNCDRHSITRYLKFGIQEKLLHKVAEHIPLHRAAEFTFAVQRFDWETGHQIE